MRRFVEKVLEDICAFITHCCLSSQYFFDILKCGSFECEFCTPPRLPMNIFVTLQHLPHPTPSTVDPDHYKPFSEVFGTTTSEEHRPSLTSKPPKKTVPIPTSVRHAKNTNIMIMCEECDMWRLVYSSAKLSVDQREYLESQLQHYAFTCGADLSNLELCGFPMIYVRKLQCGKPIERLYYSVGYTPICIYCGIDVTTNSSSSGTYPQCQNCLEMNRPPVQKRR